MVILGVDTAGPGVSLALGTPSGMFKADHPDARAHELRERVSEFLSLHGTDVRAITRLAVGLGPGSFTGIRIGLGFMEGFARALGVALSGHSSLAALAAGAARDGLILAHDDAQRGDRFASFFRKVGDTIEALEEHRIIGAGLLSARAAELAPDRWFAVGPGSVPGFEPTESSRAEGLLRLSERSFASGTSAQLEPIYLRRVHALTIEERARAASNANLS